MRFIIALLLLAPFCLADDKDKNKDKDKNNDKNKDKERD